MRIKTVALAAATLLLLALTGCGAPATPAPATSATSTSAPAASADTSASATPAASGQAYTGYLIDQKCGVSGVDVQDGSDLTKLADKHTLSCARMPGCIASGFGLSIKQTDGTYKFYKFDAAGSQTAIDTIINKTRKTDNLLVDVQGTMSGDTITVSSIVEK